MDGIAICYQSLAQGQTVFPITGIQSAGMPEIELANPETCLEVMTGACLPYGTDTVIKIEDIKIENNAAHLSNASSIKKGQHIHTLGSDQKTGTTLIPSSTILKAPELAIAASVGYKQCLVYQQPKILLITTGDEVIPLKQTPEPYQIRRSHSYAIRASITSNQLGTVDHIHTPDSEAALKSAIESGLKNHDVILITGGISKGKYDYVAPVMQSLVGKPHFHGVAQRPGKPFAFWTTTTASTQCQRAIFALPGNPVSVMACLARYILPALRHMRGEKWQPLSYPLGPETPWHAPFQGLVASQISNNQMHPNPPRNSGDYTALAGSQGICELPHNTTPGTPLNFYPW